MSMLHAEKVSSDELSEAVPAKVAAPTPTAEVPASGRAVSIECSGLSLRFGKVCALDGLDLAIAPGECVGVVGRNGAGKSTLFRVIIGAETADAGRVETDPRMDRLEFLARTGFVPDSLSVYE